MKAYKCWDDTKHYIHKNTTEDTVVWTINVTEALDLPKVQAYKFFFDTLGFCYNTSRPNALQTE
jgi:hypothetical protein